MGHPDRERPRERGGHENPASAGPPGRPDGASGPGGVSERDLLRRLDRPGGASHQAAAGKPAADLPGALGQPSGHEPYRPWFADADAPWFGADLADLFGEGPVR